MRLIPIGRPIANTRMYILDGNLQPLPVGIPGELYIGGDGLARGYLNRAELTAEKFIADPFSGEVGARLYKTGDLARYRVDGNIEFLGRTDHQVKIRGFRIELGEIEAVLGKHPEIGEVAVVVRADTPGDKILVAYLVPKIKNNAGPTSSELRRFLQHKLPEYMIPSIFVTLDAMKLTANRQGGSEGASGTGPVAAGTGKGLCRSAYGGRGKPGGDMGGCAGTGTRGCPRQLLRARGAFTKGDAGDIAGAADFSDRSSAAEPV